MRRRTLAVLATALLSCGLFCQQAQARPIQGDIDFGGIVTFDTMSLATATKVTVWNSSFTLRDSGDFATFVVVPPTGPGPAATMKAPWIFNPSTSTPALWTVGGFTFDLTTSVVVLPRSTTFLNVTGAGFFSGHGFDRTPGTWSFTADNSSGQDKVNFGFQTNAAVPEASPVAFLGIGGFSLVATQFLRRKLKKLLKNANSIKSRNVIGQAEKIVASDTRKTTSILDSY